MVGFRADTNQLLVCNHAWYILVSIYATDYNMPVHIQINVISCHTRCAHLRIQQQQFSGSRNQQYLTRMYEYCHNLEPMIIFVTMDRRKLLN